MHERTAAATSARMETSVTWAIAVGALALAVFAGWRGAKRPNPARPPRLVPWRLIMVLAATVVIFAAAHLLNLAGVATGR